MHILHIIHSLDPRSGGPSHAIREMVAAQVAAGHSVAVVATDRQSAEPWEERTRYVGHIIQDPAFAGARVCIERAFGRRRPWLRFGFAPTCRRTLREVLNTRGTRPDVIHIHGTFSHLTSSAAAVARCHRIPYIIRPAGSLDLACYGTGHQYLKRLFSQLFLYRDIRRAACVQATARSEAEQILHWLPDAKVTVIPLGAAMPKIELDTAKAAFITQFPELEHRRLLLYLSRIAPKKRLVLLVETVTALREEFPDLTLVVAGHDAGCLANVKEAIRRHRLQDRVAFTGFLQGNLKHGALAASDLFALPSTDENFGMAVVEAMAHGVPILVTRGVGSHVFVDDSGCGVTVSDDVAAIAQGVRSLLTQDRDMVGSRGRRYVEEHLSWTAVIRQLDDLYHSVCVTPMCDASDQNQGRAVGPLLAE